MLNRFGNKLLGAGTAVAVAAALTFFSAPATADAQVSFGVQGSYGTEIEAVGVGPRINYNIPGADGFGIAGSFDYFFPDGFDWWEVNANGTYAFDTESSLAPYAGAGLNYARQEVDFQGGSASNTETGLNLLGGFQFGGDGGISPFVEGRYSTIGTGQFVVTGGFLF